MCKITAINSLSGRQAVHLPSGLSSGIQTDPKRTGESIEQAESKIVLNTAKRVEELVGDSATMQRWREKMALTFKRPEVSNVKNTGGNAYGVWQKWLFNLNPATHIDVLYTLLAFCHDDCLRINPIITDALKKQTPFFCEYPSICVYRIRGIPNVLDVFLSYVEKDLASGKVEKMDKIDLIIKGLKDWRETADKFGVDSPQAKEKGAIALPLLFENRELLPESNQRFQLRGLEDRFTIDEIKTMNDGGNCDFYADKNFIADLEKLSVSSGEIDLPNKKSGDIHIQNSNVILGGIHQPENLQIGNNARIQKYSMIKKVSIIGTIAALLTILHLLGWLEPIKAFIYKILLHK